MRDILSDFRFAVRGLLRRPAFAATAILTLALGIGTTTAMYSVLDGVVLEPLPFPNADRLITLCEQHPGSSSDWCSIAPPNVEDVAARSRAIEAVGIGRTWGYHLATAEGLRAVNAGIVTPGVFTALGVRPYAGRLFEERDLIGDHSRVAILSYEMWQSRYGGDPAMLGRTITLDGIAVEIVGIAPPGLEMPRQARVDLWRTVHFRPTDEAVRGWPGFVAYGRLRPGVTLDQARLEVSAIADELRARHFAKADRWGIQTQSLHDLVVGRVRPVMLLFLGAVVAVLLIGCANVANLLLVRANARGRELAVREALGAGRARVARALFVESLVLGIAGSLLGLAIAIGVTRAFVALAPAGIPRIDQVSVDGSVLLFALALAVASALVAGLWPAIRAARTDLSSALREGGRGTSHGVGRLGAALVVVELALALTMVTGALLLARTFSAYSSWNPGFDRDHVLMFTLSAAETKYPSGDQVAALWDRVEREVAAIPGVAAVGTASAGPLFGGDGSAAIALEGRPTPAGAVAAWFDVSPGWFAMLGVPVIQGRNFGVEDVRGAPRVALVNETFARRYWQGESAIGKRFRMADRNMELTIVGVVRDVAPLRPDESVAPEVYWSNRQLPRRYTYVLARTTLPPATLFDAVRARVAAIDAELTPSSMRLYSELVQSQLKRPRFTMLLIVAFGAAAVLLATVGVYGLLSYIVSTRRREIGIRLALGAGRGQVLGTHLFWGLRVAALGVVLGLGAAIALARGVESQIAGVSARDPVTLATSAAFLVVVAVAACVIPAYRASRVDPASVLTAD